MSQKDGILDLSKHMLTEPRVRQFIANLEVAQAIANQLRTVMPTVSHQEQRILAQLVSYRIEGGYLPVSLLIQHFPLCKGMEEGQIMRHTQDLLDGGVLDTIEEKDEETGEIIGLALIWPAMERLIAEATMELHKPRLVLPPMPPAQPEG